jgi:hypothetical protein
MLQRDEKLDDFSPYDVKIKRGRGVREQCQQKIVSEKMCLTTFLHISKSLLPTGLFLSRKTHNRPGKYDCGLKNLVA